MRNIGVSLPQAANGRLVGVISEPPAPGFGRWEPVGPPIDYFVSIVSQSTRGMFGKLEHVHASLGVVTDYTVNIVSVIQDVPCRGV